MSYHIPLRTISWFATLFTALLLPSIGLSQDAKHEHPQLRIVCISSLTKDQKVILASRDDEGKWQEHATATLRSSLITDWLPAQAGELHITVREEGTLRSICQFAYPADSRHALAVLTENPEEKSYEAHLVDPEQARFVKGSVMIFNFTADTGSVFLGAGEKSVEAGEKLIVKPTPDDNGMYRMTASYLDADGEPKSCFDRYVSNSPNSRKMLFLLPDESIGMKVLSLSLFGTLD